MPANLSGEAKGLWSKYQSVKGTSERIKALEAFYSAIPKHKGNEKLQAQVKRKIATLKLELEEVRSRRSGSASPQQFIQKEGAAQIVIIGATNSGRSSLLASLTNANPEISARAFTTLRPIPGMMNFEDIQFQLIESPPLIKGAADGESWGPLTLALARNSDALLLMVDLSKDSCVQMEAMRDELEKAGISIRQMESDVTIKKGEREHGVQVFILGELTDGTTSDVQTILNQYGLHSVSVTVTGRARLQDVEDAVLESTTLYKPTVVVANKIDVPNSAENLEKLRDCTTGIPVIAASCVTGQGLREIGRMLFERLRIVRAYTKEPNESEHSPNPFILRKGSTIADLAKQIHTDLGESQIRKDLGAQRQV